MHVPIQKYKYKFLKLDYLQPKKIKQKLDETYKGKFNWKYYVQFYTDLKITNLDDAWIHFIKYGIKEKRKFFLNELTESIESKDKKEFKELKETNEKKESKEESKEESKKLELENKKTKTMNRNNTNQEKTLEEKLIVHQIKPENNINYNLILIKRNNLIYKYIYDNYENLPDHVIFLQGYPFDHSPNLMNILKNHRLLILIRFLLIKQILQLELQHELRVTKYERETLEF
jgi:hypothetical protein